MQLNIIHTMRQCKVLADVMDELAEADIIDDAEWSPVKMLPPVLRCVRNYDGSMFVSLQVFGLEVTKTTLQTETHVHCVFNASLEAHITIGSYMVIVDEAWSQALHNVAQIIEQDTPLLFNVRQFHESVASPFIYKVEGKPDLICYEFDTESLSLWRLGEIERELHEKAVTVGVRRTAGNTMERTKGPVFHLSVRPCIAT